MSSDSGILLRLEATDGFVTVLEPNCEVADEIRFTGELMNAVELGFRKPGIVGRLNRDGIDPGQNLPEHILLPDEPAPEQSGERTLKISDPLLENRILSACAEAIEQGVLQEIVAVGVGGLAVATFDLASRVGKPILLDIDRIPVRGSTD